MEADDQWSRSSTVTTENAKHLPRFQSLCEKHGMRPTYLTEWAMAQDPVFQEFGASVVDRDAGEIGMHLHSWTTPPSVPLTSMDHVHHPFLIEFPENVIREKVRMATEVLEDMFQVSMVSHRAGRWALDERYAKILVEHGYLVDCSVTPHVSWSGNRGAPAGRGPRDYSDFPRNAYFVDLECIGREGDSPLLEVPMTIVPSPWRQSWKGVDRLISRSSTAKRLMNRVSPEVKWMRPDGRNRTDLLRIAAQAPAAACDHVEFMLHSSEMMPGGSPYFRTGRSIEGLFDDMEELFEFAAERFQPLTLAEYHARISQAAGRR
ncbi:polysaccharide deacetylase family protein [Streptosporangium roseum]|uniref:polysaccharide deacetylase family protein n=1 Tax=Streptosporangium roseum TaxID=2001 RepID=UPI001C54F34A|nr:polysaccharide deacetylase family protein [Streptosporangium roseum]